VTVPPWQEGSDASVLAARGWLAEAPGGLFALPDHGGKTPKPGR
jgi:hypothetical protein